MATKTFSMQCADGKTYKFTRKKQGAPKKADDLKLTNRVTANLTVVQYAEFLRQKPEGMKEAAFAAQCICTVLFVTNKS
jgi:hypothetical protein